MIHVYCVSHVDFSLSLSIYIYSCTRDIQNIKMIEFTACQTIQALGSFRLSSLAFWRQSFVPNGRFFVIRRLMIVNIHACISFFLDRKPKLRPHVMNMHCIYQAGWIWVCFNQIKEVSNYCILLFSFNLYINKISLINSKQKEKERERERKREKERDL